MDAPIGLARALLPATVALRARVPEDHPSVAVLGDERMGSGVLVDRDLILTVNYVVIGARTITVSLVDGQELSGEVAAQDYESGIAVLRVPAVEGPAATPGDSRRLSRGQPVFILASLDATERRVSDGVITDLGPFDAYWEYMLDEAIQTSAVNPGLGGGPLFDRKGRLIGITSLNLGQMARFSMVIPIHHFLDARDDLLRHGARRGAMRRAWLGLYAESTPAGIMVAGLVPDAPATLAGVEEGDVILRVNSQETMTRPEFYRALWANPAGSVVRLGILRDAERLTLEVASVDRAEFYR
jgi:S1-C subfamily serine protease